MDKLALILGLLVGDRAKVAAKGITLFLSGKTADAQMRDAEVGEAVVLDIPADLEPVFKTRSGEEWLIDGIQVRKRRNRK